jgi:hypothetical protein
MAVILPLYHPEHAGDRGRRGKARLESSDKMTVAADGSCAPALGLSVLGSIAAPKGPVCNAISGLSDGNKKTLCCVGTP